MQLIVKKNTQVNDRPEIRSQYNNQNNIYIQPGKTRLIDYGRWLIATLLDALE